MSGKENLKEYKQRIIADFDRRTNYDAAGEMHPRLARKLVELANLQPGQVVLDVATGTGLAAIPAAQMVGATGRVIGLDISRGMLEQARRKIEAENLANLELIEGDADYLSFEAGSFDAILCASALIYLSDIPGALKNWHAWLKGGGKVAFSCFAENAFTLSVLFREMAREHGIILSSPNEALGTPEKCRQLLEQANFGEIEIVTEQLGGYTNNFEGAWNGNLNSALSSQVSQLPPEQLARLKTEYLTKAKGLTTEQGIWNDITTFFVTGAKQF